MFITFEGIDGCGKSTQIQILHKYLQDRGIDVVTIREPGGTSISEQIRDILLSKNNELSSITELLLFESARAQLVADVIKPALAGGKIVLSDRFYDSTTVYQGYGRGLNIEDIEKLNMIATSNIKPDLTFYVHISLELSKERMYSDSLDRIESSGDEFFLKLIDGFNRLAEKEQNRIIKIDGNKSIDETFELILMHLKGNKSFTNKYQNLLL